ncbi:MAG: UDP-glucose 4-epimerase GalE [Parvularculaceae bacterium]
MTNGRRIIVTGGAGYIGAHVVVALLGAGASCLVIDDLSNASPRAVDRAREIAGGDVSLLRADLADPADDARVDAAVADFAPDGAIHLAGLKAVGESVAAPVRYYRVNLGSALSLVRALSKTSGRSIVFSSSATVYGDADQSPVAEDARTAPANPYGRTKLMIEEMLKDLARADPAWRICNLRYFNPVGAHPSGRIGEDPRGTPNNLFPFIAQVAVGLREKLTIFGDDYPTTDGTGVRDYVHVCDLARGNVDALSYLMSANPDEARAVDVNIGVGDGVSALEAVRAFETASGKSIPYEVAPRRPGDVATVFANPRLADALFGWRAEKSLADMCADHWRWQSANPRGYDGD